ncbi:hypothetical protein Rhopal_006145-T1 [Rhodotorula paludigena]|uniref:PDZ domain-containing protein n=1 Tax=Rhodotorula paludigena TaxID=86838 RepID=A0AAV5GT61_9BASI|nr:hypothetical protein Rhopal_006145-T1 [Rhodotorula paludigena]
MFELSFTLLSQDIPLLSTGVHLVLLVLPTFFVELSPGTLPPLTDLRIASAGVWHNVVLLVGAWLLSQEGAGLGRSFGLMCGIWRTLDEGVLLVDVQQNSPLTGHLSPGSLITHLDDLELDAATSSTRSQLEAWERYLGSTAFGDPYENVGWCLPTSAFDDEEGNTGCCAASAAETKSNTSAATADGATLCFLTSPSASASEGHQTCLDPLTLLPPTPQSLIPPRCIDDDSCGSMEGAGYVCARISEEEQVLRIGVREAGPRGSREAATQDEQVRTVLWQGPRASVARQRKALRPAAGDAFADPPFFPAQSR